MTKTNSKKALLSSAFALVLSVAMLIGTTFAWFTDTASTAVNKIQAGNLDIEVEYRTSSEGDWKTLDNATDLFGAEGTLFEPGHTRVVELKIKNAGNLALKYKIGMNVVSETAGTNKAGNLYKLSNYLKVATTAILACNTGNPTTDATAAWFDTAVFKKNFSLWKNNQNFGNFELEKTDDGIVNQLLPGGEVILGMKVYMPETVGNEANAISSDKAASINFGLNVVATQHTYENDSFGNTYDENADYTIQVNKDNIQDYLDGKYGPINGMTLVLAEGDYDKIEFGRATAYEGSNTKYYLGGTESNVNAIKQDIANHPNGGADKREYVRSMSNVTLKAADNATVTINGLVAFGGQVNSTKWYSRDFVADRDMSATENNNICYWIGQRWSNITFEGLTFTGGVNIEAYGNKDTLIDNVKFDNCKFDIANNADETYCIRLNVDGNIAKANNLVVTKCDFANGLTAVLTDGMPNVTVTDSTFSGLTRHAINPMMNYLPKAPGYGKITVIGNTFKNMSTNADKGTILRMGDVGEGAVFTLRNNTATEGITLANRIKVNSLADGITYNISGNNWGSLTASDPRLNG